METAADYALATDSFLKVLPMTPAPIPPDDFTYSGRFAARLKELRLKAGLSVPEMVQKLSELGMNVSARTYYAWESANNQPSLDAIEALANVLGLISPRNLLPKK